MQVLLNVLFMFYFLAPSIGAAHEVSNEFDRKRGEAACISGFAESNLNWDSKHFLKLCEKIENYAQGLCVSGFSSSPRPWGSELIFTICTPDLNIAQAQCLYGFGKSGRPWGWQSFRPMCVERFK